MNKDLLRIATMLNVGTKNGHKICVTGKGNCDKCEITYQPFCDEKDIYYYLIKLVKESVENKEY